MSRSSRKPKQSPSPSAHGGKREGAGRKAGAATTKTRAVADAVAAGPEVTPLEVMLLAMRTFFAEGSLAAAADIAKSAAPYLHPKLSSIEHKGANGESLHPKRVEIVFVSEGAPGFAEA